MLLDPGPASDAALALACEMGTSFTVADWLARRGWQPGADLASWLDPKLSQLTPPHAMADLDAAADRISRAIEQHERVVVFGDYDCDGITACAILTEAIGVLGGEATPLLASRFAGDFGLRRAALGRGRDARPGLLVACDCGSSDHERLDEARRAGIDAVVIDHHLVPAEPLPVLAFLNPQRPDCGFPFKGLASCGLALVVATALRRRLQPRLDVRRWLDLVAVGTIADVAPLDGDNRPLVRRGLELIGRGERVGLRTVANQGTSGRQLPVGAEDVAYQIAPRLNAPGRLGDPMLALELLLAHDAASAGELARRVEVLTVRRRELQRTINAEADGDIAARGWQHDAALVVARQGWHPGVVGIVAGRLADTYRRPAVVVALDGEIGRGSARAPAGFRLYDSLAGCGDELIGFGGHQAAAGLEIRADRVDAFRDAWRSVCAAQLAGLPEPEPKGQADVRLDQRDDLQQVLSDLERLEPCGRGNPAPRLWVPEAEVLAAREIKGHLKLEIRLRGARLGAFAPGRGSEASAVVGRCLGLSVRLRRDHWRGGKQPELLVEAFAPAAG